MKHIKLFEEFIFDKKEDVNDGIRLEEDLFGTSLKMKPHETLMAKSVVSFMMDEFNFKAKIIVKKKDKAGLIGDISLSSTSVDGNKFYLHFNPNQSYQRMIQSMIHELTHVKQVSKNELLPNKDYTAILWNGEEHINVKDYNKLMKSDIASYVKLPWEVEANSNMNDLYSTFINSKYWKELKGKDDTLDYIIDNIAERVNLFEQYIFEKMVLAELEDEFNIELDLYDNGKWLELSRIVIPKDQRGQGIGSKVMQRIVDFADKENRKIYLTPSKDFGASSVSRLENFYKKFGFEKNTYRNETKETMVRLPK